MILWFVPAIKSPKSNVIAFPTHSLFVQSIYSTFKLRIGLADLITVINEPLNVVKK